MITILNLNPSITCQDKQFDNIIAQFEEIAETMTDKIYNEGTDEDIDAHEPLNELFDDFHTQYGPNWGRLNGAERFYIQSSECICLVIEQLPNEGGIGQAWYTDSVDDMETFAQQF